MESSHDAPIIHAFNLAQKTVNSQKSHTEWDMSPIMTMSPIKTIFENECLH